MTSLNVLRVTNLTRQVTAAHLREVFGHFGDVARVDLAGDATVGLSRGYAVVELASRADAVAAKAALDGTADDDRGDRRTLRVDVAAGRRLIIAALAGQLPAGADPMKFPLIFL